MTCMHKYEHEWLKTLISISILWQLSKEVYWQSSCDLLSWSGNADRCHDDTGVFNDDRGHSMMTAGPPIKREREQLKILHACKEDFLFWCAGEWLFYNNYNYALIWIVCFCSKCFQMANTSHDGLWEVGFKCRDLARILRSCRNYKKKLEFTPLGYSAKV